MAMKKKMIVEKQTGEKYASKASMAKAEKAESPAKKRAEMKKGK